jgi:hypothetical protein
LCPENRVRYTTNKMAIIPLRHVARMSAWIPKELASPTCVAGINANKIIVAGVGLQNRARKSLKGTSKNAGSGASLGERHDLRASCRGLAPDHPV